MNYEREALALIDRMMAKPLTAHEIALWHALAAISARCGKSEGLSVPMDLLKVYTGSSKDSVERARNGLKTKGLIDWQSQRGRKAPLYTLYGVAAQTAAQRAPQSAPQSAAQAAAQPAPQSTPLYTTAINSSCEIRAQGAAQGAARSVGPVAGNSGAQSVAQGAARSVGPVAGNSSREIRAQGAAQGAARSVGPVAGNSGAQSVAQGVAQEAGNGGAQSVAQGAARMTQEEADALQREMDDVLEAAAEIGIPQSAADLSQGNRLVADYSAAWVREAIRRAGTGSASTRCWRYVEAILRRWRERGGMDEAHQDARAPAGEEDSARLREDARTLARLRGELPR